MKKIVVFTSGNGSNFEAILQAIEDKTLVAQVVGLICDHADAYCLTRAKNRSIQTALFLRKDFTDKAQMDEAIANQCQIWQAEWLVLAGYMRLISNPILQRYPKHIVNIHPSLLPLYRGKDAIGQAIAAGEKTMGISIHYVDEGMDTGEIIAQFPFEVLEGEDRHTIETRLHALEHKVYPAVLRQLMEENT
ncbi:MAG: phosphoribosylglycinamide formyltransferase [Erysipelotrichales bacterium]|nr:MAG: phosphoribosylglycinamide formyltransferase [Erysipelotrichales bacterium]